MTPRYPDIVVMLDAREQGNAFLAVNKTARALNDAGHGIFPFIDDVTARSDNWSSFMTVMREWVTVNVAPIPLWKRVLRGLTHER